MSESMQEYIVEVIIAVYADNEDEAKAVVHDMVSADEECISYEITNVEKFR